MHGDFVQGLIHLGIRGKSARKDALGNIYIKAPMNASPCRNSYRDAVRRNAIMP